MSVDITVVDTVKKTIKLLNRRGENLKIKYPKMKLKMKFKLKHNTGMSVYIPVIDTE